MRRIYAIILPIFLCITFYLGYRVGLKEPVPIGDLKAIQKERDRLTVLLSESLKKTSALKEYAVIQANKAATSDSLVQVLEKSKSEIGRIYHARIAAITRYDSTQLDQFYLARYPDSAYVHRASYNQATAKRKVIQYEWRVRETAQDLVRLDSMGAIVNKLDSVIAQQKVSISTRDNFIAAQADIIAENDSTISIVLQREQTQIKEVDVWKGTAKKYKRQRDGAYIILAGGVVVVGGIATLLLLR